MGKPSLVNMPLAISTTSWLDLAVKVLCSFLNILYGPVRIEAAAVWNLEFYPTLSCVVQAQRPLTVFLVAESAEHLLPRLSVGSWQQHAQDGGHAVW